MRPSVPKPDQRFSTWAAGAFRSIKRRMTCPARISRAASQPAVGVDVAAAFLEIEDMGLGECLVRIKAQDRETLWAASVSSRCSMRRLTPRPRAEAAVHTRLIK